MLAFVVGHGSYLLESVLVFFVAGEVNIVVRRRKVTTGRMRKRVCVKGNQYMMLN
jgi:hypothetical protein